jgi:putative PEP-CTERM system TPR-repeat lipoprotein
MHGVGLNLEVWRLLAVAWALLALGCAPKLSEEELLARAEAALERRDVASAIVDAKALLQQNPRSARGRYILGRSYHWQMQPEAAAEQFQRAAELDDKADYAAWHIRSLVLAGEADEALELDEPLIISGADAGRWYAAKARAHAISGDLTAAREALSEAISYSPEEPYVVVTEIILSYGLGRSIELAEAVSRVEALVAEHPRAIEARAYLADLYLTQQSLQPAIEQLQWVVARNGYRIGDRLKLIAAHTDQGDVGAAEEELLLLEEATPENQGVKFARARLYFEAGEYEEAARAMSAVLGAVPGYVPALYYAGVANVEAGNYATAQRQLRQFLEQRPDNEVALTQLAKTELALGDAQAAERIARDLLKRTQSKASALGILALALSAQGNFVEANQTYASLSQLEPTSVAARRGLASTSVAAGDIDAGVETLREGLELDPSNAQLHQSLVLALLRANQPDEARVAARSYMAEFPDDTGPLVTASRVELFVNDFAKAEGYLERAQRLSENDPEVLFGLAALATARGDGKQTLDLLRRAVAAAPDNAVALAHLAEAEERAGNSSEAAALLERAVEKAPNFPAPRLVLARYRLTQGDANAALDLLKPLEDIKLDPARTQVLHRLMAIAQLQVGDVEGAISSADAALALSPEEPNYLALAAQTRVAAMRLPEAKEYVDRGLALAPDNPELLRQNAALLAAQGKWGAARESLEGLPAAAREYPAVMTLDGQIALGEGNFAEAARVFHAAYAANQTRQNLIGLSTAQWRAGQQDAALEALRGWVNSHPADQAVRNQFAIWLMESGDLSAAITEYRKLEAQAPDNPLVLNNLAWLLRDSEPENARDLIERALLSAPGSPSLLDTYAVIEMADGESDDAMQRIDAALSESPGNPQLMLTKAKLHIDAGEDERASALLSQVAAGQPSALSVEARALLDSLR